IMNYKRYSNRKITLTIFASIVIKSYRGRGFWFWFLIFSIGGKVVKHLRRLTLLTSKFCGRYLRRSCELRAERPSFPLNEGYPPYVHGCAGRGLAKLRRVYLTVKGRIYSVNPHRS